MKTASPFSFYLRIVSVSVFVALLGLAPVSQKVAKSFVDAQRSISVGDSQHAANALAEIARYFPWRSDLNLTAAKYAMLAGDSRAAIQYLERPGTVSRLTVDDQLLLADAYAQSGNRFMAEAILKHILELGDSISACQRLADIYIAQKDYSTAAGYLQKILYLDPSRIQLYYQVGTYYAITDPDKSLPFLAQAVQLSPADSAQARELHDKIRTAGLYDEPAYTALIVGRQLAEWGKWSLALVSFQRAVSLRPDYADAWALLGEAKQQVGLQETGSALSTGLPELELAFQLDPNSTLVNTFMALHWERVENYAQAGLYIQHAISVNPSDPYLYSELGNILSKAGDLPAAQSAYQGAIDLAPQDPVFYRQLAQFALENKIQIRELALPAARHAVTLAPSDAKSLDVLAQVMLTLLDYQSAERFSLQAVHADAGYAPAYLHLGTAYLYQGKAALARYWLEQAEKVDPESWVPAQAARLLEYYFPQ